MLLQTKFCLLMQKAI